MSGGAWLAVRWLHLLAMALFVGGQIVLVAAVAALIAWHRRRPGAHAVEGLILLVSLAIAWLGLALAHGPLPFG
jgi:hypothetical protein